MNDMIFWTLAVAVWFAPVFAIGWMARHWLRKDGDKVILVGLFFGLLGAAIAAIALPRLSDEEWEAKGQRPERAPRGEGDIMIAALVGGCVIAGALCVALVML